MNKVASTYWGKSEITKSRSRRLAANNPGSSRPQWLVYFAVVLMTFILCAAVNLRAYSEMHRESLEQKLLYTEIEEIKTDNMSLQEEIQKLKIDPKTIEREARKLGMSRPNEKILVPIN